MIKSQVGNSNRTTLMDGQNESVRVPSFETLKDATLALRDSEIGEDFSYAK